jgi:hypothetical protein
MNVTTIVIERNCVVREGKSSLIAEADSSDGKGYGRLVVFGLHISVQSVQLVFFLFS